MIDGIVDKILTAGRRLRQDLDLGPLLCGGEGERAGLQLQAGRVHGVDDALDDQGPQRATATISGYTAAAIDTGDTTAATYNRPLPGLRSISVSPSGVRARCAIDWLLRPGHRAIAGAQNFVVAYINYYVNGNDAYCDVGERV